MLRLVLRFKGGEGSGNFNHSGRPGQVGGSSNSGVISKDDRRIELGNNLPDGFKYNGYVATRTIYRGKKSASVHIRPIDTGYEYDINDNATLIDIIKVSDLSLEAAIDGAFNATDSYIQGKLKPIKEKPITYDKSDVTYVNSYADVKETKFGKGYMITGNNDLVDISNEFGGGTNDHPGYIAALGDPSAFGLTSTQVKKFAKGYEELDSSKITQGWNAMHKSGVIRVREFGKSSNIDTNIIDKSTLRRLQKLYDTGKLHIEPNKIHHWSSADGRTNISFTYEEFLSANYADAKGLR